MASLGPPYPKKKFGNKSRSPLFVKKVQVTSGKHKHMFVGKVFIDFFQIT